MRRGSSESRVAIRVPALVTSASPPAGAHGPGLSCAVAMISHRAAAVHLLVQPAASVPSNRTRVTWQLSKSTSAPVERRVCPRAPVRDATKDRQVCDTASTAVTEPGGALGAVQPRGLLIPPQYRRHRRTSSALSAPSGDPPPWLRGAVTCTCPHVPGVGPRRRRESPCGGSLHSQTDTVCPAPRLPSAFTPSGVVTPQLRCVGPW